MEQAIYLLGYLILTFLGIIAPIFVILLSLFREGMSKLTIQYENEKSQSEKNIKEQLKKFAETEKADVKEIDESLQKLKTIRKVAETKLSYLNPKIQTLRLFIPLLLSFLATILAIMATSNNYYMGLFLTGSLVCLAYAMVTLWKLLGIIIEVRGLIEDDKKDMKSKTIEMNMGIIGLLSALGKKETQYFLKEVYITIDGNDIKDDEGEITISTDKRQKLEIGIRNHERRMAKNVEIGFIFQSNFIIEKTDYYSIFTDKREQVVRYEVKSIQGSTDLHLEPLIITSLKKDIYKIVTFMKAENIEATYRALTLRVTKKPLSEILKGLH